VRVEVAEPVAKELQPEDVPLPIAYEDEHLLSSTSPPGSSFIPRPATRPAPCARLVGRAGGGDEDRPGIVHRSTATPRACWSSRARRRPTSDLRELVRNRELERRYKALVRGRPRSWKGRIEAPIGRDRHDPTRHSLDTDTPREA
jgi:23S rRNA pseudouridine1911/1915/1917 synthase